MIPADGPPRANNGHQAARLEGGATPATTPAGVLLLAFGTAQSPQDVARFLRSVRHGRPLPDDLVEDYRRRYEVVGGSPIIEVTEAQRAAVQQRLDDLHGPSAFRVVAAMRHSPPWIVDALAHLRDHGVHDIVAIALAPQQSRASAAEYEEEVNSALAQLGWRPTLRFARPWYDRPSFIEALLARVAPLHAPLRRWHGRQLRVIATAHSLPRMAIAASPDYPTQVAETAIALARRLGDDLINWKVAFQSAVKPRDRWIGPSLEGTVSAAAQDGAKHVLVVPVQFLCDHLEVRWDIDVLARAVADRHHLGWTRPPAIDAAPQLVDALVQVVHGTAAPPERVPISVPASLQDHMGSSARPRQGRSSTTSRGST